MNNAQKAYAETISNLKKNQAELYGDIQKGIEEATLRGEMYADFKIEHPVDRRAISSLAKEDGFKVVLRLNNPEVTISWGHLYEGYPTRSE